MTNPTTPEAPAEIWVRESFGSDGSRSPLGYIEREEKTGFTRYVRPNPPAVAGADREVIAGIIDPAAAWSMPKSYGTDRKIFALAKAAVKGGRQP